MQSSPEQPRTPHSASVASAPAGNVPSRRATAAGFGILVALVFLAYANHFHNAFHFDDDHTVVHNPYIRDLRNLPRFFTDARTIGILPSNQAYRPLLTLSLAIDYRLSHGLHPLWFHISTFFWYLVLLLLMDTLFRRIFDAARPNPRNPWVALFATALYGLHPVMAETVNYIMQRADLYSTLGVVAGLLVYIAAPALRRYGLYLLPVLAGLLSKEPAAVFPALLFAWVWLFEEADFEKAVIRCLPAVVVTGFASYFVVSMNSPSFTPGGFAPYEYRISQPAVLLTYFRKFFLPMDLSVDTDRRPYTGFLDQNVLYGILFVLLVGVAIFLCRKRRETRPIAFGLFWFLVSSLPTSWIALSEVENDHRMFFPFVGLALSVCWTAALGLSRHPIPRPVVAGVCALLLASFACGTHERNKVWHSEESLWLDATEKSPANGRGLMNYALTQMAQARYPVALDYFNRALVFNPAYYLLEVNLGIVSGAMNDPGEAERHFLRAIELAPTEAAPKYFYARWLNETGRISEAIANLKLAIAGNPAYLDARYLLMQIDANLGDGASLRTEAAETLAHFPSDATARVWLARAPALTLTPEGYLNRSLDFYRAGKYAECIATARQALKLRPDYAGAWNNIAAAYNALSGWDDAIAAGETAVGLDPTNRLARNNLAWAHAHKAQAAGVRRLPPRGSVP